MGWVETGLAGVAGLDVILTGAEVLAVNSYLAGAPGRAVFETVGRAVMVATMLRLNSLPRTDPFWHNTNLRLAVFKLWEFCYLVLREEPDDLPSHWSLAVLNTLDRGYFQVPVRARLATLLLMGASFGSTGERFGQLVGSAGQSGRGLGGNWMVA